MKTALWLFVSLLLCGSSYAQDVPDMPKRTNSEIVEFILRIQERRVLEVADAMPADKYDFAPTRGEFKGVRTFAEALKHLAADNYLLGAGMLGEKAPGDTGPGERGSAAVHGKAQVIAYVKDSFAYMHRAVSVIDDRNEPVATPAISPWPDGTATRLGLAIEDCVHTWDHYGQLELYLRMNGIIPPESRK